MRWLISRFALHLSVFALAPKGQSSMAKAAADSCDESKCRATRPHPWSDGDSEWTCWIPRGSNATERKCVDGYEGRAISVSTQNIEEEQLEWYTCCPSDYAGEVTQQCSDETCSSLDWEGSGNCWGDGFQDPLTCDDSEFRYPRPTGEISLIYLQYICCTTPAQSDPIMEQHFIATIIWSVLSGITFLSCVIFIGGIMSCPQTRVQGYNIYLVFLAIPDSVANLIVLVRCILSLVGAPVDPTVQIFFASMEYFYASSNMWLNAIIVWRVHVLLQKTRLCMIAPPPAVKQVCREAAFVYAWAAAWFGWAFALYYRGLVWFSLDEVVNAWIVTQALMVGPPLIYVLYVTWDVHRKKLLPLSGSTRVISLYFLRVVIVFLVTWVPYYIIYNVAWIVTGSRTMVQVTYFIGSLQGLISVSVAMTKPDVKRAVFKFMYPCQEEENNSRGAPLLRAPEQRRLNTT